MSNKQQKFSNSVFGDAFRENGMLILDRRGSSEFLPVFVRSKLSKT